MVYTPEINNRINYIFTHVLFRLLKQDFLLTSDKSKFNLHKGPRISYHTDRSGDELLIIPYGLLNENQVKNQNISVTEWNGIKIFFRVNEQSDLPFDIFSSIFYLITRYEEYLPHPVDKYGRFKASQSLAFKNRFHDEPIVEKWVLILKNKLKEKYPEMIFHEKEFQFQSTIDIDNPFAFLHKGLLRTLGAFLKSTLKLDIKSFSNRILTLKGSRKDPYETYDYINDIEKKYRFRSVYFFLVGDYKKYDTNISIRKIVYQNLIGNVHKGHKIGLHSSFSSTRNLKILREEKQRLSKVINGPITRCRQHYLTLKMPDTYQRFIEAGIREDYSMGYANFPGFRAGTCNPFNFYDLSREHETNLIVYPFQVMEVALHNYMQLNNEDAIKQIFKIIDEVKKVNGLFISLWHNESLSEYDMWTGWRVVFEKMVKYATDIVKSQSVKKEAHQKISL